MDNISIQKKFIISISIVATYMILRFFIYAQIPVFDLNSWVFRDSIMNLPRILCLLLTIFVVINKRNVRTEFLTGSRKIKSLFLICILLICMLLARSFFYGRFDYSGNSLIIVILNSFVVGFFEETLFRGAIFESLKKWIGSNGAAFWSSVLFMIYHVQAQNLIEFPLIFLLGLLFAILKGEGFSLINLALLHAIFDSVALIWIPSSQSKLIWSIFECTYVALIVVGYLMIIHRKNKE